MIKKQLEDQQLEITTLKNIIKEQELKLRLRKNDFERVHSIEQKKEIMVHKERVEALYR
jgi:flavoprotein